MGANNNSPIRAVVEVSKFANLNGVSYELLPAQVQEVNLGGGGRATNVTFTLKIPTTNTGGGTISYQATLSRLENAQAGVTIVAPSTANTSLTVAAPSPTLTPTPTPTPTLVASTCPNREARITRCLTLGEGWDETGCRCAPDSPVIIDVQGDGISLTDAAGGVNFDLDADGVIKERVGWTLPDSDDAFLFIDRNGNGVVDNGVELFGNVSPQPYTQHPNGFVALGYYDRPMMGGNGDGMIDERDTAFAELRLWRDANHNGVSEFTELSTLAANGIESLSFDYAESRRVDRHGNEFRYRAKVQDVKKAQVARWAWDVFLASSR